jgi:outer membrane cobalamin receptor
LTRTFIADHLTTEAMVQGVGVSQFGFFPGGSLGSRYEIPVDAITHAFFVRAGYSNRFPTLIDRYYIDPSFMGNSGVTPERDTTVTGGYEWSSNEVHATLEGYYQYRDNVLLPTYNAATFTTIANTGTASISSLLHSLKWAVVPWLDLGHSLSLTQSEVHSTGAAFPYVPSSLYRLYLDVHSVDQPENWNAGFDLRTSSSASVTQTTSVADYTVFDFNAGVRFSPLRLTTKVENVFDVRYQVIRDYLMPGRTYSILGVLDF